MPSWSALVLSAAWLGGAASLALLAKPSSLSPRAAFASWCCVVGGAAELDATVLLLLATTSHSDDAGTIRSLALLLLGLRGVVASVLAVYCSRLARRSLRQASGPSPGGLRSWLMLLVLLPLNLELLQLLPWPVVKHDGLPTAAVLASCTAASLAHGLGTALLSLWFASVVLPSGELADSMLTEGGALPLGLLLSLGSLYWLGARRVRMLLRDPALAADDGADAGRLCVLALPTAAGVLDERRSGGHDGGASDDDDDAAGGAVSCANVCLDVACSSAAQPEAGCASALELDSPPADGGARTFGDVASGGEASGADGSDVQSLALSRQRQLAARARVEARQRLQALAAYPATPPPLRQRSSGSSLSGGEPSDSTGGYNSSGSDFLESVLTADAAGLPPAAHRRDHALSRVSELVGEEGLGSAATPLDIAAAADSGTTAADTIKHQVQSRVRRASESNSHRRSIEAGTAATTAAAAAAAAATAGALREAAETSCCAGVPADAASAEAVRVARRATSASTAYAMAAVGLGGEADAAIAGPPPGVVASRLARAREAKAASAGADSGTSSDSGGGASCGGPPRSPGIARPAAPRPSPGSPQKDIQARVATHMARVRASTHDQQAAEGADTGTCTATEVGSEAGGDGNDKGEGEILE